MEYIELGNTGLKLSRMSMGGIPLQRVPEEDLPSIFQELVKQGINFIDTARGYTISERQIGKGLKVVGRDKFYLASKTMGRTAEALKQDFATTMSELDTELLDLYQFHNISSAEDLATVLGPGGAYEAALQFKEEGKIAHIGVTSHNKDLLPELIACGKFETIQFPFNYLERQGEEQLIKARKAGIGTLCMKPLAGGALKNHSQALRFVYERDEVIQIIIPGMDSVEQIRENAAITEDSKALTKEDYALLDQEAAELGDHFCLRCGYCAPCTVGISIPSNFLMEGYYTRYNLKDWAKERYQAMEKNAADCIECGACEPRCPYNLPIIEMLKEVDRVLS